MRVYSFCLSYVLSRCVCHREYVTGKGGAEVEEGSRVTINCVGRLLNLNGVKFFSTKEKTDEFGEGTPLSFTIGKYKHTLPAYICTYPHHMHTYKQRHMLYSWLYHSMALHKFGKIVTMSTKNIWKAQDFCLVQKSFDYLAKSPTPRAQFTMGTQMHRSTD